MTISFSKDELIDSLYWAILGREPDEAGRVHHGRCLEAAGPEALRQFIKNLLASDERNGHVFHIAEVVDALHISSLGRPLAQAQQASFRSRVEADPSQKVLERVASAIFHSSEHQDRFMPVEGLTRTFVDHTPHGDLLLIIRHLIRLGQTHNIIVEAGLPSALYSYSIDLAKYFGWQCLLIEPSVDLQMALEQRFSATRFKLLRAQLTHTQEEQMPSDPRVHTRGEHVINVGMPKAGSSDMEISSLEDLLIQYQIPEDFDVLAFNESQYKGDIVNKLISKSGFRPQLIIAPSDSKFTAISQLDLGKNVEENYEVAGTTDRTFILRRR